MIDKGRYEDYTNSQLLSALRRHQSYLDGPDLTNETLARILEKLDRVDLGLFGPNNGQEG